MKKKNQEATANLATAKESSMDAAAEAVLSWMDVIFVFKKTPKNCN